MTTTRAYKVFSHSLCSPIQGGAPVWDGSLPYVLPCVEVDGGPEECAAGWNACANEVTALRIGGLWRDGWPARLYAVETDAPVIARGDKLRASTWTIVEQRDIRPGVDALSRVFGEHAEMMRDAQLAWHAALGRPDHDVHTIEAGLYAALDARELPWTLTRYVTRQAIWAARTAWAARAARAAWDAWAARAARAARDAWDARAALVWRYAAVKGWTSGSPDKYDIGLRDAYHAGLIVALPTGLTELGWCAVEKETP